MSRLKRISRVAAAWLVGAAFIVFGTGIYGQCRYGSLRAPLILVGGDALMVTPSHVDLGELQYGALRDVELNLRNLGDTPIDIVGCRTSCTCLSSLGVPATLQAGEQHQISLAIRAVGRSLEYRQIATLYVDGQRSSEVAVPIRLQIAVASMPQQKASVAIPHAKSH